MKIKDDLYAMMEIPVWAFLRLCGIAMAEDRRIGTAGQAFTNYRCLACGEVRINPSTATPNICPGCTRNIQDELMENKDGIFKILRGE